MAESIHNTGVSFHSKSNWIVAYTRPRAEKDVESKLKGKGINCYLPLKKTLRQWSDRKKWVEEPLFRSYVFLYVTKTEYYKAVSTTGIVRFITNCGKPLYVKDEEIVIIKNATSHYQEVEIIRHKFSIGDKVIITEGALKGTKGILLEYKGKYRVAINIGSLGYSLIIDIAINKLQLI
jgi:transcriptional antiterminator RfaH